jgi:copper chaperone CopZ
MQDMFYGQSEPVWVLKPEKDDKKNDNKNASGSKAKKEADDSILSTIPYYPYYYPDYVAPSTAKKDDNKETKVVMKVPVCCGECVESIETALYAMKGVKSVECNIRRERVTVVATTAAPADILMACRNLFRKLRMWSDDD